MMTFSQDLGYAWRSLRKRPGFTVVAAATLALGIGANTAIFSVVQGVVLEPLPYPEPGRLITVWENHEARGGPRDEWTGRSTFADWREQNRVFESLAAYTGWGPTLTGGGEPESLTGERVSFDYFEVLGARPQEGRLFAAEEEKPGAAAVVVLADDLWKRRFGADPDMVGESIVLDGLPVTVAGVLPAGFRSPFSPSAEIWTVLTIDPSRSDRGNYFLRTVGRLRAGIDLDAARADLARVARQVAETHPDEYRDVGATLVPLHERLVGPGRPALLALLGAVGLVLLIACANVANLLLARSASREREMAIRASLGAGRFRLVRQLLTESLLLAVFGGGLGLLLGGWGTSLLKAVAPRVAPRLGEVGVNLEVLVFTCVLTFATGVLFGLVPAFQAARLDLTGTLQEGGRTAGAGVFRGRLRSALVVVEVALAVTLLVGAGLLIRSFWTLTRVDPGFEPEEVAVANLALPAARYDAPQKITAFYERLMERLGGQPAVAGAGAISVLPMSGGDSDVTVTYEGRAVQTFADQATAWYRQVTPGYFAALGMRPVRGRTFDGSDRSDSEPVVIVNETLARRRFSGEDPLGRRLKLGGPDSERPWMTIVGVVGDVRYRGLGGETVEEIYLPVAQLPSRAMAVVLKPRAGVDPFALLGSEVRALDPDLPIANPAALEALVADSVALPRFTTQMLAAFSALALVLAAIGIYGVLTYAVSQRTREIGVRMALGAERRHVLDLVVSQGLKLTALGLGVGLLAAFAVTRFFEQLLFGVRPTDPATFAATVAVLIAIAALACYVPARRATRVDPVVSLRQG